jgi:hypothetical protein
MDVNTVGLHSRLTAHNSRNNIRGRHQAHSDSFFFPQWSPSLVRLCVCMLEPFCTETSPVREREGDRVQTNSYPIVYLDLSVSFQPQIHTHTQTRIFYSHPSPQIVDMHAKRIGRKEKKKSKRCRGIANSWECITRRQ